MILFKLIKKVTIIVLVIISVIIISGVAYIKYLDYKFEKDPLFYYQESEYSKAVNRFLDDFVTRYNKGEVTQEEIFLVMHAGNISIQQMDYLLGDSIWRLANDTSCIIQK